MIVLGEFIETGYDLDFYPDEVRTTIYVTGSPNQGKSTLLGNLAEQFCAAGEGVLVLDIKGDLARELAGRTQHPERVVYVKLGEITVPGQGARYWTLNPFEGHRESVTRMGHIRTAVLESFERMGLAQLDSMANIRNTLQHAIELALTTEDPTYIDLYAIVADEGYRKALLASTNYLPPLHRKYWVDLDDPHVTTTHQRQTRIGTTRNRLEGLLSSASFNLLTGQYQSTLRLKEWLDEGKMILVDLGLPLDPYTGEGLGNMITAQLMTEIYTRQDRSRTWRLVVDEFHRFVGEPYADIITQARSYNVFSVLAHQDLTQLSGNRGLDTLKGAVGHAGIRVLLRGSRQDRQEIIRMYSQELADELFSLSTHTALVSYVHSPPDTEKTDTISLKDWVNPTVPGQLEVLATEALRHTLPKKALSAHNYARYWDRLGLEPNRVRKDTHGSNQSRSQATAKPPSQVREGPDELSSGSGTQERQQPPHPGRARPPRAVDQRHAPGSALPRPPRQGEPQE